MHDDPRFYKRVGPFEFIVYINVQHMFLSYGNVEPGLNYIKKVKMIYFLRLSYKSISKFMQLMMLPLLLYH